MESMAATSLISKPSSKKCLIESYSCWVRPDDTDGDNSTEVFVIVIIMFMFLNTLIISTIYRSFLVIASIYFFLFKILFIIMSIAIFFKLVLAFKRIKSIRHLAIPYFLLKCPTMPGYGCFNASFISFITHGSIIINLFWLCETVWSLSAICNCSESAPTF
jgi:hypothetical protein